MKKLLVVLLALMALLSVSAMAETVDAFSSASVADFYGASALTGDDLMNAVNAQSGTYLVSTTNPDGSPNTAYFVFAIKKVDEKYYLQLGLAENQSKQNLTANGKGLAVYAANPSEEEGAKDYTVSGARIWFEACEDQDVIEKLNAEAGRPGAMFFEIVEVRPLG